MVTGLAIAPDLTLPLDFATEGVLVTGMRGSGKSNSTVRFIELEYEAGIPFALVDPKGDSYGIRSSADGKGPGLSVPVFGGLHGDFPLEPHTGARVADLLVDEMLSAVLDVSLLSKTGELPRFLTAWCNRMMERHHHEPHVRTIILAEAHRYIPQAVTAKTAELKEAAAAILLEGRAFGLGCWAETQRPARLNKDVVEEVGAAILHRIGATATNDKRTLKGWVEHHELGAEVVESLTTLKAGQGWLLAPERDILQLVQFDRRRTFDSAATPKPGAAPRRISTMADIDQAAIKEALADVIEKAKADDPKELRSQLRQRDAELDWHRQLWTHVIDAPPVGAPILGHRWVLDDGKPPVQVEVEVPVLDDDLVARLEAALEPASELLDRLGTVQAQMVDAARKGARESRGDGPTGKGGLPPTLGKSGEVAVITPSGSEWKPTPRANTVRAPRAQPVREVHTGALPLGEAKILTAVAQYPNGVTKEQLTVLTGYKRSSRDTYLQRLRTKDLITMSGGHILATEEAFAALGPDWEPLPTGEALQRYWLETLPAGEKAILAQLLIAEDDGLDRDAISQLTGYKRSSRDTYLQRLRSRQLIQTDGGMVYASATLFG